MLKRNLLQKRQLISLEALVQFAARAAGERDQSESPRSLRVHQISGTGMPEVQIGLASEAGATLNWRCLIVQPDYLEDSINHMLRRAAQLDPEMGVARIEQSGTGQTAIASARQIKAALKAESLRADDFQLIIINNTNRNTSRDFDGILPHLRGARLVTHWMTAKTGMVFPPSFTQAGVVWIDDAEDLSTAAKAS